MTEAANSEGSDATPSEPDWLSDGEAEYWRTFIDGSARLQETLARDLESEALLDMSEYGVLVSLSEAPDWTMRMSDLAATMSHSRSRMTHTCRRLERRGLVFRDTCTGDGRGVNCVMTQAGMALLTKAAPGHVKSVRRYLVDVVSPDELATLGAIMDRVMRACSS